MEKEDDAGPGALGWLLREMRAPLRILGTFTALIRERAEETGDAEILSHLDPLERASRRLLAAIAGAPGSGGTFGRVSLHPQPIPLAPFVRARVEEWLPFAAEKGLEVSCRTEEPDAVVRFDESCLWHALASLLDNAIRFTDAGSIRVVQRRNREGGLVLEVFDTGRGIEAARLDGLFDAAGSDSLPLARSLLARNGASLGARSEAGLGSCFSITFAPASELGTGRGDGPREETRPRPSRPVVLLVEDEPDHQELARHVLADHFDVDVAASAREARARLGGGSRPALILMDLSLGGEEGGIDLTRWLRRHPRWKQLPIVAVTAHALEGDRALALESGCSDVLTKPFPAATLLATVGRWTESRRASPAPRRNHLRLASSR